MIHEKYLYIAQNCSNEKKFDDKIHIFYFSAIFLQCFQLWVCPIDDVDRGPHLFSHKVMSETELEENGCNHVNMSQSALIVIVAILNSIC